MSQTSLPLKIETVAEVCQTESGALVVRPRPGARLPLTAFAETRRQADGSFLILPLDDLLVMEKAMDLLGVPYTTMRRIIELEAVEAYKRSPGRWVVTFKSILALKDALKKDPEYWEKLKGSEPSFQGDLKL
jgi:hypothetical protein